ncbi:RecT family recombinase [Alkalihalophilus lindianensis]|uniref:RecT family recombinase n=1 Tax=Alkalihalophilus lindianensis TaxID=1630542 RepID=A0ABU3X8R1_9BACI|nr:RecT family recombinase [Alkalihalophilus lindianensis]MDV2683768.1 RecT family recombinase [Alkalihalophilus lindianensis]MDV2683834.1 RecT family recombinase [Alkalihalophilus lindianensis]
MSNIITNQLAEVKAFTEGELQTIQDTLAKGTTPEQFSLFIRTAAAAGLNPMLNHIYCIVYGGKMSLQVSVEGIMYLAKRVEGYQGVDVQLVYENDEYKAKRVRGEDGRYFWDVEHEMSSDPGQVIGCYAFAYREGFPPVFEYLKADEVEHNLKGNNAALWKKYYNDMFKKHVVKRAAKRQYGIEISEEDVAPSGNDIPEYKPERKDITPNETTQPAQHDQEVVQDPIKDAKDQMQMKFASLGIEGKEAKGAYIKKNAPNASNPPTLQQLEGLLKIMDLQIEEMNSTENDGLE